MQKDAHGDTLKIGDKVQHIYPPLPAGDGPESEDDKKHWHNFFGVQRIVGFPSSGTVEVTKAHKMHIPVHLLSLVELVKD